MLLFLWALLSLAGLPACQGGFKVTGLSSTTCLLSERSVEELIMCSPSIPLPHTLVSSKLMILIFSSFIFNFLKVDSLRKKKQNKETSNPIPVCRFCQLCDEALSHSIFYLSTQHHYKSCREFASIPWITAMFKHCAE